MFLHLQPLQSSPPFYTLVILTSDMQYRNCRHCIACLMLVAGDTLSIYLDYFHSLRSVSVLEPLSRAARDTLFGCRLTGSLQDSSTAYR